MNGYLCYVDGRMTAPGFFSINVANTATKGMVAYLTVASEKLKSPPKYVDVFEVRSGSIVRRYHADEPASILAKDDENPERLRFQCHRVANTI